MEILQIKDNLQWGLVVFTPASDRPFHSRYTSQDIHNDKKLRDLTWSELEKINKIGNGVFIKKINFIYKQQKDIRYGLYLLLSGGLIIGITRENILGKIIDLYEKTGNEADRNIPHVVPLDF